MSLAEQRAVRASNSLECIVIQQALSQSIRTSRIARIRRIIVESAGHGGDLRAIEQIKRFTENLESCAFRDVEAAREAHIDVPNARLLERVAGQTGKASTAAGSVSATGWRSTRSCSGWISSGATQGRYLRSVSSKAVSRGVNRATD